MLLKTRPRDLEETLLQLINDDDQVIAAVAIDVVRQQQMWSLGDDIEHVLAHRDVHDWYVFEAASWALAERRMPAERRRELWLEPLPAAEIAGRLRTLAALRVGQRRRAVPHGQYRHGRSGISPAPCCSRKGRSPTPIHVLLDGRVASSGSAADQPDRRARDARLRARAAGRSGADDCPDRRHGGDAGADGGRVPDAARRQHRPRPRIVHDARRARRPGDLCNLQSTGAAAEFTACPRTSAAGRKDPRASARAGLRRGSRPTR